MIKLLVSVLVAIMPLPPSVFAADTVAQWERCLVAQQKSKAAKKAQQEGGVEGLNEFLIDKCGFRPTLPVSNHRALAEEDCDSLLEAASEGECDPYGMTGYRNSFVKQLDPRVFKDKAYTSLCEQAQRAKKDIDRTAFGKAVCGE